MRRGRGVRIWRGHKSLWMAGVFHQQTTTNEPLTPSLDWNIHLCRYLKILNSAPQLNGWFYGLNIYVHHARMSMYCWLQMVYAFVSLKCSSSMLSFFMYLHSVFHLLQCLCIWLDEEWYWWDWSEVSLLYLCFLCCKLEKLMQIPLSVLLQSRSSFSHDNLLS